MHIFASSKVGRKRCDYQKKQLRHENSSDSILRFDTYRMRQSELILGYVATHNLSYRTNNDFHIHDAEDMSYTTRVAVADPLWFKSGVVA
jgi:hypothetical protein